MLLWPNLISSRSAARECFKLAGGKSHLSGRGKKYLESQQGKWRLSNLKAPRLGTDNDKAVGLPFRSLSCLQLILDVGGEKAIVSLSLILGA